MKNKTSICIENALSGDIDGIKKVADANKKEIGFVLRPALIDSMKKGELLVAKMNGVIVGFLHWHWRKDKWNVIYQICVFSHYRKMGIGEMLFSEIPTPKRLKCPTDLPSNSFYLHMNGKLTGTVPGKKRMLNAYEWK